MFVFLKDSENASFLLLMLNFFRESSTLLAVIQVPFSDPAGLRKTLSQVGGQGREEEAESVVKSKLQESFFMDIVSKCQASFNNKALSEQKSD